MGIKQFLKPDWKRIILIVAIGLITYALMISSVCLQPQCMSSNGTGCTRICPPLHSISVAVTSITAFPWYITNIVESYSIATIEKDFPGTFYETVDNSEFTYYGGFSELLIGAILEVLYLYLISCILVSIINKFRRGKK